jgi:hypothetical protein
MWAYLILTILGMTVGCTIVLAALWQLESWIASRRNHSPRPTNPVPPTGPAPDWPLLKETAFAPPESPSGDPTRWIWQKLPDGDTDRTGASGDSE